MGLYLQKRRGFLLQDRNIFLVRNTQANLIESISDLLQVLRIDKLGISATSFSHLFHFEAGAFPKIDSNQSNIDQAW